MKRQSNVSKFVLVFVLAGSNVLVTACSGEGPTTGSAGLATGSVGVALSLAGGATLASATYTITGPQAFTKTGTLDLEASGTLSAQIGGIPAATGYSIELDATSTDGGTTCAGSASFDVTAHTTTPVTVHLDCHQAAHTGSVLVNGVVNVCPVADGTAANPADIDIGSPTAVSILAHDPDNGPAPLGYQWSAPSGSFSDPSSATPTFTCNTPGPVTLSVTVSDGDSTPGCADTLSLVVTCEPSTLFVPGSLVVSSTTYDNTQGAVASLAAGTTKLAGSATATVTAVAANDYVDVWTNESVDASFGVTSLIRLSDVDATNGNVMSTVVVPPDQVVTSFPSKSELGLHLVKDASGSHLVFVGYAGAGVGALDVSNTDAVAGQDPTNPVTFAFGATYAFARTIVSMDETGHFKYTPTVAYGGNNGRSALLGSNGLYYAVGNANNGNAAVFGAANGTNPDVTETTGLEVVAPIDGSASNVAIPANDSAEVNPLLQYTFGTAKPDKPGKDNNYRGVTEFGGALYFTKGSGSNGMQTVYTVGTLPTVANAATSTIGVVPGFPTDSAKATGGDFTPFAVFFANATTMYVTDEGTGDATDVAKHAGLEKWSLVGGTWQLDYVLTAGLVGQVDTHLNGAAGPYPDVTTIGLRNLTGVVNGDKVTLWAATSTSSAATDNGADPNKIVTITDELSATTLSGAVTSETFATVLGPTYGTAYRGVAFVQ
ncbi:MAG TPA: hypothetical protein VMI54_14240 [Polyangiaceae bacterium]|nr:hypothetical protein [Polyangiaceae bacterium]